MRQNVAAQNDSFMQLEEYDQQAGDFPTLAPAAIAAIGTGGQAVGQDGVAVLLRGGCSVF